MQDNKEVTKQEKKAELPRTQHLALEVLEQEHRVSKAKDLGIIGLTVAVIAIAIGLSIINYKNDVDWRELFGSYDYVYQDGEGINSINTGTQGDLNNGSESENKVEIKRNCHKNRWK